MQLQEYYRIENLEKKHFWYRGMRNQILDFMEKYVKHPAKILDAGCGTGGLALDMKKLGKVYAIDINDTAILLARKKDISVVKKANIEKMPFKDNVFDAVVCLDVLYHRDVRDDGKAIEECFRILKPGGIFIIRLPAFEFLRGSHDIVVYTKKRYTINEVSRLLQTSGFSIEKLTYANMFLSMPLTIKRIYERLFLKTHKSHSDVSPLPSFLNNIFLWILLFENIVSKKINLPFGSSVVSVARKPISLSQHHTRRVI